MVLRGFRLVGTTLPSLNLCFSHFHFPIEFFPPKVNFHRSSWKSSEIDQNFQADCHNDKFHVNEKRHICKRKSGEKVSEREGLCLFAIDLSLIVDHSRHKRSLRGDEELILSISTRISHQLIELRWSRAHFNAFRSTSFWRIVANSSKRD